MPVPSAPKAAVCPHCGQDSCYHCWECGADVYSDSHKEGCNGLRSPAIPICKACQGTGRSSNNKRCHPCNGTGRQGAINELGKVPAKDKPVTINSETPTRNPVVPEHPETDARPSPEADTGQGVVERDEESSVPIDGDEMSSLWD